MRHCATSRKVAGLVPCGVIEIFHCLNPSGRTMALGSTPVSNRNKYQGHLLGGKGGRCLGPTTLPLSCADCLEILEASASWSPKGLSRPVIRDLYCIRYNRLLAYNVLRQKKCPHPPLRHIKFHDRSQDCASCPQLPVYAPTPYFQTPFILNPI